MFERLPTVLTDQEILDKAFHKAAKLTVPDPNKYHRLRKEAVIKMRSTSDIIHDTLMKYPHAIGDLERLRKYEAEVLEIVVGLAEFKKALGSIQWAADKVRDIGREHDMKAARLRDIPGFHDLLKRHYGRLSSIVKDINPALEVLRDARAKLKLLPTVGPDHATVVIAGFPNVGKTSLLRTWTGSRAEIAEYAFTTKHAEVGHFDIDDVQGTTTKVQVVDTPGLLDRPESERNDIERQAAAALRYAADAVLFVLDPTEACGYSLVDQEALLAQTQEEMHGIPILVAESKADLPQVKERPVPEGRMRFSTHTGEGLEELQKAVVAMLPLDEPDLDTDPLELWKDPNA